MGKLLDEYIDDLISAEGDPAAISECVRDTVLKINALNEECGQYLIDTWRRERLCGFINSAAETAGLSQEKDLTQQHRIPALTLAPPKELPSARQRREL